MTTGVKTYFENIKNAVVSIFEGMSVTLSYCVRKPTTIQYPDKIPKPIQETLPEGYRGILEVDVGTCTGCGLCQRTCPLGVIRVETERNAETKERFLTRFDIDIAQCMFCGLCTEACPTGAIHHSTEFEASTLNVINLVLRYIKPGEKIPVYKPVKGESPQRKPLNTAVREAIAPWDAPAPLEPDVVRGEVRWKSKRSTEVSHDSRSA